jgi:hypothetical protein
VTSDYHPGRVHDPCQRPQLVRIEIRLGVEPVLKRLDVLKPHCTPHHKVHPTVKSFSSSSASSYSSDFNMKAETPISSNRAGSSILQRGRVVLGQTCFKALRRGLIGSWLKLSGTRGFLLPRAAALPTPPSSRGDGESAALPSA